MRPAPKAQAQHLDEILQMAEDLGVPLTLDELLTALREPPRSPVPDPG